MDCYDIHRGTSENFLPGRFSFLAVQYDTLLFDDGWSQYSSTNRGLRVHTLPYGTEKPKTEHLPPAAFTSTGSRRTS